MLKKRIMIFKGDIQKHGIKYALACQVIFHGEQSSLAIIKRWLEDAMIMLTLWITFRTKEIRNS